MDTRKSYTYETKKQAVELYFEGLSTREVADRLEIQNPSTSYGSLDQLTIAHSHPVSLSSISP